MSIIAGLIGAVASVAVSCFVAARPARAKLTPDGWHLLLPGPLLHCLLIGTMAMLALFGFIILAGGSTRPDAEQQNAALYFLIAGFGFMGFFIGWAAYWTKISWRGSILRLRTPRKTVEHDLSAVVKFAKYDSLGLAAIYFKDHAPVYFSTWLKGASQLEAKIHRAHTKTG
jgi:hypothetical protein